jgi:hypothetical protein
VELEELRKNMVRSYERWYYGYGQRARRFMERAMYYMENPQFGKKRLGRALGIVPPPPLKGLRGTGMSSVTT